MINTIILFFISLFMHPVHVSVSNIDYIEKDKKLIISIKLFTNDLETILDSKYKVNLNLGKSNESVDATNIINKYISDCYNITFNNYNKSINSLTFKEKKITDDNIWLYYEIKNVEKNIKTIYIKNSILIDLYKDQSNLLIISYLDFQNGYTFKYNDDKIKISL